MLPSLLVMVPEPLSVVEAVRAYWLMAKVAPTLSACVSVTTQLVLDSAAHAPLHPVNAAPSLAMAFRVTICPCAYVSLQSLPQSMPPAPDTILPAPVTAAVSV